MDAKIPIVCNLSERELQLRRQDYLNKARAKLIDLRELDNGFSFEFALENSILQDLAEIIDLERQCCPFLNFKMILEAGSGAVWLELTGEQGTKEMLKTLFG